MASARNSMLCRSVIGKNFDMLKSTCFKPGPRSELTGQLPSLPGAGFAIVVGSNQMYPGPYGFSLYGVSRDGAMQSGRPCAEPVPPSPLQSSIEIGNPPWTVNTALTCQSPSTALTNLLAFCMNGRFLPNGKSYVA